MNPRREPTYPSFIAVDRDPEYDYLRFIEVITTELKVHAVIQ